MNTPDPSISNEPHGPKNHTVLEDIQAFVLGTFFCAVGVTLLTHMGLITGQTAGLGVLLSYITGWSFGLWFFVLNLPFYVLAWIRMGARFTQRSFVAVGLLSVMTEAIPGLFTIGSINPAFGSFFAGALIGIGLIVLFRHGASLGGIGVLALYLQEKYKIQAGWVQLGFDALLFVIGAAVLELPVLAFSLLGAFVVNLIVAVNHRKDRYIAR